MQLYDRIGTHYADYRRPDPRIASAIGTALGDARCIVNVGAGAGSYEPLDRAVVTVEPSEIMIRQRLRGSAPVVCASAMALPFHNKAFDVALALLTVHHWPNQMLGLSEMARVAKICIILTFEPSSAASWLTSDYFPEIAAHDRKIFPMAESYRDVFDHVEIRAVPIPHDCSDGFLEAYWRRPEVYFDPNARSAISSFARFDPTAGLARLRRDLDDGSWHRRHGHLLKKTELDLGYRLLIAS